LQPEKPPALAIAKFRLMLVPLGRARPKIVDADHSVLASGLRGDEAAADGAEDAGGVALHPTTKATQALAATTHLKLTANPRIPQFPLKPHESNVWQHSSTTHCGQWGGPV
jgi:hypothetical protein